MQKSGFYAEQVIAILAEKERGMAMGDPSASRDEFSLVLRVEGKV